MQRMGLAGLRSRFRPRMADGTSPVQLQSGDAGAPMDGMTGPGTMPGRGGPPMRPSMGRRARAFIGGPVARTAGAPPMKGAPAGGLRQRLGRFRARPMRGRMPPGPMY